LNWKCGIGLGAAREKVRVAHALKGLPKISDEFRLGEISYSKVRALTRVATEENEDFLIGFARHGTASHVERLVRQYRRVKRNEALELENERHARRELHWFEDDDGSLVFKGRFTPEQGALLKESKDVPAETPEDHLSARPEPIAQRRADAMVRVAENFLNGPGKETGGDRYLVHVHTDMETLKADGSGAEAEIDDCCNVSAETSRRSSCDAGVVHWLEDKKGEPLSVGRKTRTIPPAIRRALQRRDQGCRFPGCTCSRFVDAHHITHWADGGETNMDNLVLLCRRHHRLVHEEGFGVHTLVDGQIFFTDQQGQHLPDASNTRSRGNVFSLMTENSRSGIQITPQTGECRWGGETMDDDLAVLCMLQLE
jgi:5-methylcytosine-specific restriction endonuclease McrA